MNNKKLEKFVEEMRLKQNADMTAEDQELESLMDDDEILSRYGPSSKRTSKDISVEYARNSTENRILLLNKHDKLV